MSVNAINPADTQQPKNSNLSSAVGTGLGLGALGGVGGYFFGGKTPSLEEVFAQEPDTFESSLEKMKKKDDTSATAIKSEYEAVQNEIKPKADVVAAKQEAVDNAVKSVEEFENKEALNNAVTEAENNLAKEKTIKIGDADVTVKHADAKSELDAAKAELAAAGEDAAAKEAAQAKVNAAQTKVDAFKGEVEALDTAKKKLFDAKKAVFEADSSEAAVNLRTELNNATNELATARETAIGKVKDKNTVVEAFGKVKKALTEGKGRAAMIYGGIALAVGLLASLAFGQKKEVQ